MIEEGKEMETKKGIEEKSEKDSSKKPEKKKKRKKQGKKPLIILVILALALAGILFYRKGKNAQADSSKAGQVQTATASYMNISSELTASSSLAPKDTYEVTSLVEGEILEANFEEGDIVEKGQVLYRIDASSMDTDLSSAETSLTRAKENLTTARENYNEAVTLLSGNTYKSTASGYIKKLYVKEGDKVGNGTQLADIYDDTTMKLVVPFLTAEADQIGAGSTALITLEDTGEQIEGTVTNVSSLETTLSGGRLVKNVTVEVTNPGGLTADTQATASVNSFICAAEGVFEAKEEFTLSADFDGNGSLEIENLLIAEGSRVEKGTGLFTVTAKSAEDYVKTFQDSLNTASDNLQNAENQLSNTQDNIDDYTITAPISGTIVTKNSKVGDKISRSSGSTTTAMAVIYDLSSMTLEMSVDELDVSNVKVGQSVEITADALEGETFHGTVTNVSLQGSYSNGVTNYPVTVTLEKTGDLRPGMNVDAKIILDSSENALCIPAGALMRGDRVYVKGTPETTASEEETAEGTEGTANSEAGSADFAQGGNVPDGFYAVQVKTGVINDDYVEILSGLSEGDEVYVDPNAGSSNSDTWMMGGPGMGFDGGPGGGGPGGPGGGRP